MTEEQDHHHSTDSAAAAICPVCRMSVDPDRSPSADFQGQTYYFCNEKCERAFLKHPSKFTERVAHA